MKSELSWLLNARRASGRRALVIIGLSFSLLFFFSPKLFEHSRAFAFLHPTPEIWVGSIGVATAFTLAISPRGLPRKIALISTLIWWLFWIISSVGALGWPSSLGYIAFFVISCLELLSEARIPKGHL